MSKEDSFIVIPLFASSNYPTTVNLYYCGSSLIDLYHF